MTWYFIKLTIFCFVMGCVLWQAIGLMSRVFANGAGFNRRSSHTKDSKMVLDAALLNTQHYKVSIMGKVEISREWSSAFPYTLL